MKKIVSKITVVAVLVIFVVLLAFAIAYSCLTRQFERKIFTDKAELEGLARYEISDILDDTSVPESVYSWSYSKLLEYNGVLYEVFAYNFTSSEYAKEYFMLWSNVSDSYELEEWDFALYNRTEDDWSYILYSDSNVFRINGKDTYSLAEFVKVFTQDFKKELK